MKAIKFLLIILATALIFTSCTKGPAGPTAPQGSAGINGSSNVTITSLQMVFPSSWFASSSTLWYYNTTINIPATDVCNIYISTNGFEYYPLPAPSFFYIGDAFTYGYSTGSDIQLFYVNPNSSAIASTVLYFHIADIPPAAMIAHPQINWNNWDEVNVTVQSENKNK